MSPTETATETKTETEVEIGIKGEKRASAISFLRRGPNARSKSAKPNFRQKIERAVNSPWPWGKSLQNEDDDGNNATKPLSQKYVLNYISDPNHPLVDNHELDRLHPHNPFFQVQQGVPFQQVVPERPARFPYPRKIEYTSTCSRTGLRIRPTVSSCYNNHSSTFSTDASTSSTASSQHSLTPLLAMSTSYANQQQQQLQYFLSSQDEEEARRREQVHRFLLQRVKTREGSNQVRRRTNIVLTNPAFRQETEPVVVARFRRIYSRDKQQQQIPVETKEDHRNSTAVAITSNCMRAEFISRLSTHNIRGSKGKENFKTVHATTSFKKQFERYQQLCRERAFSRQTPRASTPIESTGTVASPKLTFERTNLVLTSIRFQEVSKQQQGFDQSSSSSSTAFLSSLHSFGSTPFDAESHKFLPVALEHHIKRASHRFEDNGTGVCFNMQTQELSPTRCLSLNHLSVTSLTSASSNISSVYSTLSARWQRPLFYEKSKSRRYPQSLQVHIKVKDGGQQQQVVDGTAASVFDVNDTSAMRAAGIDPEEAHADPEAFYHRHFAYFQKHGSFLEDITSTPTTKVEPEQAGETATSSVVPEPKAESSTPELCDNRKLLAFLPRPLKRVVTATRGSWSRSRRTLPGLVKRAKVQCQSSLARLKEKGKWKEKQVKEIHEILFMSASMNRRWKDNDEEEIGAWVLKIPADHGRIGQFDCNWLDALEV
ncbi:hypothetical protein BGZ83_007410 [Gryganskiella cystojenkinii]|nr:hypothetical protein BGZ83_007410 [Gryganskiella cystojenkinii]